MVTARPGLTTKALRCAPATFHSTDLLSVQELTSHEVREILDLTKTVKARPGLFSTTLKGKQYVMMFEKPSLRTRVTFEAGINSLGGHALFMECQGGIEKREKAADVARNLERWVQGIILRTFRHSTVTEMAAHANIPVINALTDREHPCQALADFFTLQEKFGDVSKLKVAFVGDGNNVAHSLMLAAAHLGCRFSLAVPAGYDPAKEIVQAAKQITSRTGAKIEISNDPQAAVAGADAVYTDVWASMGQESEAAKRDAVFRPFQVNTALMSLAAPHAVFMHCLPAHRGAEVTDEVLDSPQSVVYDEAENRLHVQNAILVLLAGTNKRGKRASAVRAARA